MTATNSVVAREVVSSLLGQPPGGGPVLLGDRDRVDHEALIAQVGEGERLMAGERVRAGERNESWLLREDLDFELGLAGQQARERDVDCAVENVVDASQQQFANADFDSWETLAERAQHVRKTFAGSRSVEADGQAGSTCGPHRLDRVLRLTKRLAALLQERLAGRVEVDVSRPSLRPARCRCR